MLYDKQRAGISVYHMGKWLIIRRISLSVGEVYVDESSLTQMGRIVSQVKDKTNISTVRLSLRPAPILNTYLPTITKSWPAGAHV